MSGSKIFVLTCLKGFALRPVTLPDEYILDNSLTCQSELLNIIFLKEFSLSGLACRIKISSLETNVHSENCNGFHVCLSRTFSSSAHWQELNHEIILENQKPVIQCQTAEHKDTLVGTVSNSQSCRWCLCVFIDVKLSRQTSARYPFNPFDDGSETAWDSDTIALKPELS